MQEYNTLREFNAPEDTQENSVDYCQGSLIVQHPNCWFLNINAEFIPYKNSIIASGRFHVYYIHPQQGTSAFIVEKVENGNWIHKIAHLLSTRCSLDR